MFFSGMVLSGAGCREPNYNTEITPDVEGGVTITRTPKTPEQIQAEQYQPSAPVAPSGGAPAAVAPAMVAPVPAPAPADPDLASVESSWPHLSPTDRQRVADMARRLAEPPPQP